MKNVRKKPGLILWVFIAVYLVLGVLIVKDYGFSSDERIEKRRAAIALSKYGLDVGYLPYDYQDLGHSQFYGTATSMLLLWGDHLLSPRLGLGPGVVMHYGYFLTFVAAAAALYYLVKLFVSPWIALFTAVFFATQPLLFGHAFMNPKDIPMLAVFIAAVTTGFYVDTHRRWVQAMAVEIDLPNLARQWRRYLVSLPRSTYGMFSLLLAALVLTFGLRPILIRLLTQIITTAYTDHQSLWGIIFTRMAANLAATPLEAYVDKGVTNLVRLLNGAAFLLLLGLLGYGAAITRKGYHQLPLNLRNRSILHALSVHLGNPMLVAAAFAYGFAISTRIVTIFAGGIVGIYLLWTYRRKALLPLAVYTLIAAFSAYFSWPIFWQYGFSAIFKALSLFAYFDPYIGSIHFRGEIFREYEVPRDYLPHLLAVQFTEPLIILCILGFLIWVISLLRRRQRQDRQTKLLLIFLWFSLPFAYVVITAPIMYNNFRQFIFITPPLFVFSALAIQKLSVRLKNKAALLLLLCLLLVPGIISLVSLHPYQYIHFNQYVGGVRGAFRNYDLDYSFLSLKEAIGYINEIAPENASILVWDVEYPQAIMYNRPDIRINRVAHVTEEDYASYQYAVIPVIRNHDLQIPPEWEVIHTITRSGADLAVVYRIVTE
jgi:hypothetical protein